MSAAGQGSSGNVIAAVCSFFIPGLGQLVQGRVFKALIMFVLAAVLWSHRRKHGSLPPGVDRFADLFGIPSNPLLGNL